MSSTLRVLLPLASAFAIRFKVTEIIQFQDANHKNGFSILPTPEPHSPHKLLAERGYGKNDTGENSTVAFKTKNAESSGSEFHDDHGSNAHSNAKLRSLREATTEQADEILSVAIETAKEPDNLARLKDAAKEANGDSKKAVQLEGIFFRSMVWPILHAKGFQEVPIQDFFLEMEHLIGTRYDGFMEHALEVDSILQLELGLRDERKKGHSNAKLTPLRVPSTEPPDDVLIHAIERADFIRKYQRDHGMIENLTKTAKLKPFREASAEEVDEVLRMAINKAKEPYHLSVLEHASKGDAVLIMPSFNFVVLPILSAKGFQDVPFQEFVEQVHHVAEAYGRSLERLTELDDILRLQADDQFIKPVKPPRWIAQILQSKLCWAVVALCLLSGLYCCMSS